MLVVPVRNERMVQFQESCTNKSCCCVSVSVVHDAVFAMSSLEELVFDNRLPYVNQHVYGDLPVVFRFASPPLSMFCRLVGHPAVPDRPWHSRDTT